MKSHYHPPHKRYVNPMT